MENENLERFKITFGVYIKSGFPVILCITGKKGRHAINCCGFLLNSSLSDKYENFHTPCVQWEQIYFHDDRIGPYAKGRFRQGANRIELIVPWDFLQTDEIETWSLNYMIVPLYNKLRTSAQELISFGRDWIDLLGYYGVPSDDLYLDFYFKRSGDTLNSIRKLDIISKDKTALLQSLALSRYVGIVDMYYQNTLFMKFLLDTTDRIYWNAMDFSPLLGVIIHRQFPLINLAKALKDSGVLVASR